MSRRAIWALGILVWLPALAAAARLDRTVAEWVKARAADTVHTPWRLLFDKSGMLLYILRLPGYFYFTIAIAGILLLLHARRGWAAALVLVSGMFGGLLYGCLKWLVGRHRPIPLTEPFHVMPFAGGLKGLFVSPPNLSFPSGHATLSFATAAALAILVPRWGWAFFVGASLVATERVLENAHYLSDVFAGAGLGVISAALVNRGLNGILSRSTTRGLGPVLPHGATLNESRTVSN